MGEMSQEQKRGKQEKGSKDGVEQVVVAVKASKEIPKTALVWALTHVVQPGYCITLLVVVPSHGWSTLVLSLVHFCAFDELLHSHYLLHLAP